MKIIKEGKLPDNKILTATCANCKTEIEFTVGESRRTFDQRDGDYVTVTCPLCGCDINRSF